MQNKTRLKIWVCEFISAGGLAAEALPASLLQEGLLMRNALLSDLYALGIDCITSHDARVPPPVHAHSLPVPAGTADVMALWRQQLLEQQVDACWVIAPETGGILQQLHAMVHACGLPWIGCDAKAIQATSDKVAMAQRCAEAGVPVVPHLLLSHVAQDTLVTIAAGTGWVLKPRDGAGCEHTYYFKNDGQLLDFKMSASRAFPTLYSKFIVQPFIRGQALSCSAIATDEAVQVIAAHRQQVDVDANGVFQFKGAAVNAASEYLPAMQVLATQIKHAIPGLNGYWGADLILEENGALRLMEINPRLTTPYIALSRLMTQNPAAMVLDAFFQQRLVAQMACGQYRLDIAAGLAFSTEVIYD